MTDFVTALSPPRGADPGELLRKAEPLRGWVDAVNITDNMAPGYEHGIPGILERAGLARRDPAVPAPTLGGQRAH